MSSASTFSLLYKIETQGLDSLDGITRRQQQVNLETKYSAKELREFENILRDATGSGQKYGRTIEEISRSSADFGKMNAKIAQDILQNDRAVQMSAKETARIKMEADREMERSANSTLNSLKSLNVLAGVNNSRALDSVIGRNAGSLAIPALAATATIGAGFEMVKGAAENARQLQNLADEMGITAQEAFKLKAAANLVGIDFGTMSMAAGRLAVALEEPDGAGKKTAETLAKLGVDVSNGMGNALEQVLQKLGQIPDHAKAIEVAREVFGRAGAQMVEVADQIDKVGQSLDQNVQQKLLEANRTLNDWSNTWTIWKGTAAAAITAVVEKLNQIDAGHAGVLSPFYDQWRGEDLAQDSSKALGRFKQPVPKMGDISDLSRVLSNSGTKRDIDYQIAEAKRAMEAAEGTANRTRLSGSDDQKEINRERDAVIATRKEYERLEAAKKAAGSVNRLPDALASLTERADTAGLGPLGGISREQMKFFREYSPTGTSAETANAAFGQLRMAQVQKYIREAGMGAARTANQNEAELNRRGREFRLTSDGTVFGRPLSETDEESRRTISTNRELIGLDNQSQRSALERGSRSGRDGSTTPNTGYAADMDLAQKLYTLNMQNAQLEDDSDRRRIEQARAYYEFVSAADDARIERENKIIEIGRQQKEETRNFAEGLFTTGMSGQSGGMAQYLRNFGMGIATNVIGNAADTVLPSFNQVFSLGKTGALGSEGEPSFLGKLLKGTPFDRSAQEMGKDGPLITSQDLLRTSIDTLTATIGGKPPSGTSASGTVVGSGGSIFGSFGRLFGAPGGTAPFVSRGSTAGASSLFFGGGSDLIQNGLNIPLSMMAGHSADVSAMADMVPTVSIPVSGGYSLAGTSSFGIPNSGGSVITPTSGGRFASVQSGIARLFGGASTALGGHALQGIFTGGMDNGDGTGQALSGLGRVGAVAGLAGGTFAGVEGAISGFGQGGGRGISKGLGSILGTASMFDPEPISHALLGTGAAIAGIVSSLFGDPVAQKQKQIDETLTNQQFIEPNQHNYSYSAGGGGVDFGADGSMRSGAQQAGYTVQIQAMDAASMYSTIQRNSQAFGSNLSQSLGSSGVGALASEVSWHALHP